MGDKTSAKFTSLGAIIQEFNVDGQNIVQGFATKKLYEEHNSPWFGANIGRVANRIKDGIIRNLNGRDYQLEQNDAPNALHGGSQGWGRREFEGPTVLQRNGQETLLYTYRSFHNEAGYPGTVDLKVFYTVREEKEGDITRSVLDIEYEAELVGDECEETVINLTNHSYFNLGSGATTEGTIAKLSTQDYLPLEGGIPRGPIEPYPSQVTKEFTFGPGNQFDDVFVMEREIAGVPLDTRGQALQLQAEFRHPDSHLNLQVYSTEPAFQFYTGQGIDVPATEGNPSRGPFAGFCIEPSRFVNAINEPAWRHTVVLKKGAQYGSKITYKAWRDPR
ncbi:aldose 1-epimerase [Aspergillus saccharolyticus JOP 1030-1]|uniref:Aldose 1-epimerase n=1 Tax=Aspergillus saccharolyticus JOP 1030-1 TaxID=1450539 RepID=A0A318Z2E2_9EURO|nr:aldose 1-epimerase [Aspergillus saccharolyticus JOP 1030-1]PYH41119.1 aldose 1-epimerase [Aspergillus saccharolyticus JOP 1030-1]